MFKKDELVSVYTRAQAIEDGVLIDISENAKGMFKVPVAITRTAFLRVGKFAEMKEGEEKRIKILILMVLLYFVKNRVQKEDIVNFAVKHVSLKSMTHPGDHGEQVITIMLPYED